jgi:ketosteroid isomerase-like protein/catechol 2,3-dioxygenase-like lactoylglutathione lyase family enzyme
MNSDITNDSKTRAERAFRLHLELFTNHTMTPEAYANLITDDVVHEYPYAPVPFANRVEGRHAVTAHLVNVTRLASNWSFTNIAFSATSDPNTVFVEFEGGGLVTATGKTYRQVYNARLTMRGEQIAHYRELFNPNQILEAFFPNPSEEKVVKEDTASNRLEYFHHVGITVRDLEATIAWYEKHLGFKRLTDFGFPGASVAFIGRGDLRLEFFQIENAMPMEEGRKEAESNLSFGGINHFAIFVDDLDVTLTDLKSKGVEQAFTLNVVPDGSGDRYTFIRDNEDMLIELYQPGSQSSLRLRSSMDPI